MDNFHNLTLDSIAHLIQSALTPVFLLSGIAALLNVFATRLARVADRLDSLSADLAGATSKRTPHINSEIGRLHRRSLALDTAVVLGTLAAAATCLAILTLFLLALSNVRIAGILLFFFGCAIVFTLGSVVVFGVEMLISSQELRKRMRFMWPGLAGRRSWTRDRKQAVLFFKKEPKDFSSWLLLPRWCRL